MRGAAECERWSSMTAYSCLKEKTGNYLTFDDSVPSDVEISKFLLMTLICRDAQRADVKGR